MTDHMPYADYLGTTRESEFGPVANPDTPIFLIDMDGVLVDLTGALHRRFEIEYPHLRLTPEEEYTEFFWELNHADECHTPIAKIVNCPGFFLEPDPMPGAIEGINALAELGEVFILTAPMFSNPTCMQDKVEWVRFHLGKEWTQRLIIAMDKTTVRGDYLLDDRPRVDGRLIPTWEHILYGHNYNKHLEGERLRVRAWTEFVYMMGQMT